MDIQFVHVPNDGGSPGCCPSECDFGVSDIGENSVNSGASVDGVGAVDPVIAVFADDRFQLGDVSIGVAPN
ncbi:MAG: hypothetical protein KDA88_24285 [Planctomycetaceae bacterium]|nr:hypothetical protein [Planctomycetaceae bacterium]MCB9949776.1 hypothetical protein [Planctomycetaceae bacterium]